MPVVVLVGGQADHMAWVAVAQVIDLVEEQLAILARIQRDAVVECQRDIALFEERHQVIKVFFRSAAGGGNGGTASRGNLLDQCPVVHVRAGQLDDGHVEFHTQIHRGLIERRCHRNAAEVSDFFDHAREVGLAQFGVFGLLDVAQLGIALEVRMDEFIHVTKLQLDCGLDVVVTHDRGVIADDLQAAIELAPMVVGKLEDEQIFKQLVVFLEARHDAIPCCLMWGRQAAG